MQHRCPILDEATNSAPTAYSHGPWSIVRCETTGMVFLANPPSYSQLTEQFAWEKTWQDEAARRRASQPIAWRLSQALKRFKVAFIPERNRYLGLAQSIALANRQSRPLRFLDIGCGCGSLMKRLHKRLSARGQSAIPMGIEVSQTLAGIALNEIAHLGGKVLATNAIDGVKQLEAGSVDLVLMASFLEHECQPRELLHELRRILSDHGAIVIKVPNFACWNRVVRGIKWSGFRYPDHVNYFTPTTLRLLAEKEGYAVIRQSLLDRFPLNDNMYAVLSKAA